jgi:hypothetical protein
VLNAANSALVVFHAEGVYAHTATHAGGILIVRAAAAAGISQVLYLGGVRYSGTLKRAYSASHLCLLRALRTCRREHWGPVHVVGDNMVALRQQATRSAPGTPWRISESMKARRCGGVYKLDASAALKRAAQSTQQELAGVAERDIRGRARWAAVLAFAEQDTSYWMTVNGDSETGGLTTRAV